MSSGTYQDFFVALGHIESGDNYGYVSAPGYLGYYQFGEEALKAIGFYQGDGSQALDFTGGWTSLAASYGVHDKASFLASPAGQDAAAALWFQKVDADINTLGLGKYEGQTLNGHAITGSGLLAGAHLVGVWGLKSFLESGGTVDPVDGNGEPVSDYIARFGGYDTPFSFDHAANDALAGGPGGNYLRGGDGADTIQGGAGFDDINGNKGDDLIDGGAGGDDWLLGGQGDDQITARSGNVFMHGNIGADTLVGGVGADTILGGQGDDLMSGGAGADWLSGDRGNDTMSGGAGADTFHAFAGGGHDVVTDFDVLAGDRVQLDPGAHYSLAQVGADTVVDFGGADQLVLQNVALASLPGGWIVGG